jgi:copper chaperone CopZ
LLYNIHVKMTKAVFRVSGMHCPSCEMLAADVLSDEGVKAKADFKTGEIAVEFDDKKITLEKIKKLIESETSYKVIG